MTLPAMKPALLVALGMISLPAASLRAADVSANIGWNSEYIYRGIPQKTSSAFGGLDLQGGGFNLGTWAADVGDGLEVDFYGGYAFDAGEFSFSVGGTWYTYTGDFDDEYLETNFGLGWKWFTFDVELGYYKNFDGPTLDYQFYSITAEFGGIYGKIGSFADDFDGSYYEAGYGNTLTAQETHILDYTLAIIHSDATLLGGKSDTHLILILSKSFDF